MTVRPLTPDDPHQIGRYRILGELGSGGMGRVLLGTGADGRLVAVKQVHPHLLDEVEYRSRFRREVAASARVSGAFTAPVIDFDVDSAAPWLASVFVVGLPLDKTVSEYGPLPPAAVRRLAAGLASALQAIHQAGLIHRDLKPANVLLAADGPRVIDFGIAFMAENPSGLTETGSVLGSPAFMSPEQTLAERLTPASDVFSLGSVLMMAATGSSPFTAPSLAYTLFNIAHTQPQLESLPPELRSLIEPCLHKDPAARPSPAQILDFLGDPTHHEQPWPPPVHAEIDRQHAELVALTADPDATSVLPGARRFTRANARHDMDPQPSTRRRGPRALALIALAALLVIASVATAAVVWMRGNDTAQAASPELTLDRIRGVDSCAWLKKALGDSIPADIAGDFPTDVASWQLEPYYRWGCASTARSLGKSLIFKPGDHVYSTLMTPTGNTIPDDSYAAGQPVLGSTDSSGCNRAITTAGDNQWGLSLSGSEKSCRLLDYVVTHLVAVENLPQLSDTPKTLATVDPCLLADPVTLQPVIGSVPATPAQFSAHVCKWDGAASIEISMNRSKDVVVKTDDPVIDIGGGRQLSAPPSTVDSICHRQYIFRMSEREYEVMDVEAQGNQGNEKVCTMAEAAARTAVDRLPQPK